ncbi:MAG: FAD-dependent oxidoreductase, partial [Candidatus Korarchaeum sp.]|nr:FAD-dependent oxidoreductase [Candidatus Korarchaeum sp.]MDW8035887.1 FAD-dependent oxidoreductase [Candidatus Korarchaeum sp.]
ESIHYDKVIIATGLSPVVPRVDGIDLEGIGTVWDLESVRDLLNQLGNEVVVVGGSATGIEVASELSITGRKVTLIEAMEQLMPGKLDPPISSLVMKSLSDLGVKVMLKTPMERLEGTGGRLTHVVTPKGRIEADTAIVVIGAKPNISVATESGLLIGETGGIKVDDYMFTSDPYILAAGDVAEVRDFVTGKPTLTGLASTALVQGRIAAENAVGGRTKYLGALSPFLVSVGDYFFGGVGLSASRAEAFSVDYIAFRFSGADLPRYMKDKDNTVIWMVTDREGKLLGAQVFGRRGIRERILFLTAAIYANFRVQDIRIMEFAYQPEVCDVLEPIATAAEGIYRKYLAFRTFNGI